MILLLEEGKLPYHFINSNTCLRSVQKLKDSQTAIDEYILSMRKETNPTKKYEILVRNTLRRIDVMTATQEDIVNFLNSLKKPEDVDPLHKWIGTYNIYLRIFRKFFKWINNPYCMEGIKKLRRKEKSIYSKNDLWTQEDDELFLRYCPSKRDRCYHMIARDSSCRPSEILRLKVKDLQFRMIGNRQFAEISVNGKTGQRRIPLINSLPYVKDYLDEHTSDPDSYIFRSVKTLSKLNSRSINNVYKRYKRLYFPRLLNQINKEDKERLVRLLRKPWNPYVQRHTSLSQKAKYLREATLRSYAGWVQSSTMVDRYVHYFGDEITDSILEEHGIKKKFEEEDKMKPVSCSNCGEPNKIDAKFCVKCRMILTYDAYTEVTQEKDQITSKIDVLESQIQLLVQSMTSMDQGTKNKMAKSLVESGLFK